MLYIFNTIESVIGYITSIMTGTPRDGFGGNEVTFEKLIYGKDEDFKNNFSAPDETGCPCDLLTLPEPVWASYLLPI